MVREIHYFTLVSSARRGSMEDDGFFFFSQGFAGPMGFPTHSLL